MKTNIHALIAQLKIDKDRHEQVENLTESEIRKLEEQNGVKFPRSYKTFLQEFGDGAYWLYGRQSMDSAKRPFWLKALHPQTPDMIPVDGDNPVPRDSLLCLMTEDSNGGSWCWLTSGAGC